MDKSKDTKFLFNDISNLKGVGSKTKQLLKKKLEFLPNVHKVKGIIKEEKRIFIK